MKKQLKFSIRMPAYNGGRVIGETIESILSQSFGDYEFIIVDDNSTDDTAEVIKSFKDPPRIKYFKKGKRILDVGCGDGSDAEIFIKEFGLETCGIDVYRYKNIDNIVGLEFRQAGIFDLPFSDQSFDYVFLHDVLHHIDEPRQRREKHTEGLRELRRVCKKDGFVIIVEANRYNFLFYPHMTLMKGHQHFKQSYFIEIIKEVFKNDSIQFRFFEAHLYPSKFLRIFKVYEKVVEKFSFLQPFLAYNATIIQNVKNG